MDTKTMSTDLVGVPPPAPETIPAAVWGIAAVITFGAFMSGLDASLVNVGLSTIGSELNASLASTQWIASAYLLALAAALPASGWLSRRLGAGRVWLWSLAGFTLASLLCAVAPTIGLLIAARVLQGTAGGLLVSTGITILAEIAGPGRMGRILAITGVPTVLAPAMGPTVGALMLAHLSWPWLFLINAPIGVLGLLAGWRFVPRGDRAATSPIDLPGLILVATGFPLLTYAITEAAHQQRLVAVSVLLPLLGGLIAIAEFARRSLRREFPLLDLRLFSNRVYTAAVVQMTFGGAALFGGQIVMPLYFLLQREQSIFEVGLLLLPFGLGAAVTFPIAGRLADRYDGGRVAAAGLALTVASTLPMTWLAIDANLVAVEVLQVIRGVGLALAGTAMAAAMSAVARHQLADASAGVNMLARVGGAIGSAVFVVILTRDLALGASGAAAGAAFHTTFWWLSLASIGALVGAAWLVIEQRRTRANRDLAGHSPATPRSPHPSTRNVHRAGTARTRIEGELNMIRIAIVIGSTRPGRKSEAVAHWVHDIASTRTDATFEIIDLADYALPHLDEPVPAAMSQNYTHAHTRAWAETIASFDGYIFVTPEYNHSTSGVLKNAIDYLYVEWHNKAAGFVSYGLTGGTRAAEHLRLVMGELQVADVRAQVELSLFTDYKDMNELRPGSHHQQTATAMLDQVVAWAGALKPLRATERAA